MEVRLEPDEVSTLLVKLGIAGQVTPAEGRVLLPSYRELEKAAAFFDRALHPLARGFEAYGWIFTVGCSKSAKEYQKKL